MKRSKGSAKSSNSSVWHEIDRRVSSREAAVYIRQFVITFSQVRNVVQMPCMMMSVAQNTGIPIKDLFQQISPQCYAELAIKLHSSGSDIVQDMVVSACLLEDSDLLRLSTFVLAYYLAGRSLKQMRQTLGVVDHGFSERDQALMNLENESVFEPPFL